MGKFNLNYPQYAKFKQAIVDSYASVVETINDELDAVFEDTSEFSDLGFDGQDIIDTGRLKDSKQIDVKTEGDKPVATWSWDAKDPETGYAYAAAVYTGFMAYGKKYIPGRPWVDRAIRRVDPVKALHAEMRSRGVPVKIRKKAISS